uniref:mitotic interactor and substrate of PLK1 n=1 Tax=Callospermophilus lateralis TaxID=76772 RepID=UPI004038B33E
MACSLQPRAARIYPAPRAERLGPRKTPEPAAQVPEATLGSALGFGSPVQTFAPAGPRAALTAASFLPARLCPRRSPPEAGSWERRPGVRGCLPSPARRPRPRWHLGRAPLARGATLRRGREPSGHRRPSLGLRDCAPVCGGRQEAQRGRAGERGARTSPPGRARTIPAARGDARAGAAPAPRSPGRQALAARPPAPSPQRHRGPTSRGDGMALAGPGHAPLPRPRRSSVACALDAHSLGQSCSTLRSGACQVSRAPAQAQVRRQGWSEKKGRGWPLGSSIPAVNDPGSRSRVESPEAPKETPIEREIRLAQEREADLREQRGLRRAAGYQELVEIPTRPVLTKVSLAEAPRWDRGRPSLYVQRDMVQETQREEDHRREGLQAARASTPDWASEDPQPGLRRSRSSDSILGPTPDARAADPAPASRKVNRISPEAYQPYLAAQRPQREFSACRSHGRPSGPSAEGVKAPPKAAGSQRQLPESSGKPLSTEQGTLLASEGVVRWDHFRLRPLRFRVPDVPQRAEAPQAGGWEAAGAPVSRLHKSLSSDLLEREVESVLRREREVAAERRSALFPEVFSPPPEEDCEPDSRSSSRASGIVGSYSVSESPVFTPIHLHSGLVWKAEAPAEEAAGQRKKGLWYAGINPADQVNSEILGATRVTRHKNVMAERWEAGIYAIEDED